MNDVKVCHQDELCLGLPEPWLQQPLMAWLVTHREMNAKVLLLVRVTHSSFPKQFCSEKSLKKIAFLHISAHDEWGIPPDF